MPLVLERRIGERFTIRDKRTGEEIEIELTNRNGNWVRLHFKRCPKDYLITRPSKDEDNRDHEARMRRLALVGGRR